MNFHDILDILSTLIIPLVCVIWWQLTRRMDEMEKQMKGIWKRFDLMNDRCMVEHGQLESVKTRCEDIQSRLERIERKLDQSLNGKGAPHA